MILNPLPSPAGPARFDAMSRRSLGGMSVFATLMTIPQVFTIWIGHQATGDPTAAAKAVEDTAAIAIVRQWKRVRGRLVIG